MKPASPRLQRALRVALALLVAGCLDVPVASVSPSPTPTPEPTPVTTTYTLDATVWYEGLLIHVDAAVASLDERGGPVEFRLRLENPNEEEGELNARILLQVDSTSSDPPVEPTRESQIPTVPAHGFAGAVMTFELQEVSSVENAVLLIGEAPAHVGRVALVADGGAKVFEPLGLKLSGANAINDLRLTLRSAVLRWDLPDWSEELPDTAQALTLTYDAAFLGDFAGGFAFTGENVRLRLPDGTWISPRRDGHSQSIELIGPGKTKPGLTSRFEIPSGTTGRFAVIVRTGPGASRSIPFVLGG